MIFLCTHWWWSPSDHHQWVHAELCGYLLHVLKKCTKRWILKCTQTSWLPQSTLFNQSIAFSHLNCWSIHLVSKVAEAVVPPCARRNRMSTARALQNELYSYQWLDHCNTQSHVARVCQQFLKHEGTDTVDWSISLLDLNPIENICDIIL